MPSFRRAAIDDVPQLAGLLGILFAQEAEFKPDEAAQLRGLNTILSSPGTGAVVVAEKGGRVVGMVNLIYIVSTALGARVAILEDLVVDPDNRGKGLGSAILTAAIETARADGCRRITLLTDGDNVTAHRFYQRFGFTRSTMLPYRLSL